MKFLDEILIRFMISLLLTSKDYYLNRKYLQMTIILN